MGQFSEVDLARIVDAAGYRDEGSIAVAVVNANGDIVRAARGGLTPSTRVYGASLTKQIVAALIAQEASDKRIDVDAPLATWFSDFPAWANAITVRQVIHHISGLPTEDELAPHMVYGDYNRRTSENMVAAVRCVETLPALPGERWAYSNIGYVLLGRILEQSAAQSLPSLFAERVFAPLGMTDSLLWNGPTPHPDGGNPLDPSSPIPHSLADGGMWTTANDLTHWIRAMNADRFGVLATTMVPGALLDGSPLTYAWGVNVAEVEGTPVCSHGGGWHGSISRMAWFPERGAGFIAFTIDGGPSLDAVADRITARLAAP